MENPRLSIVLPARGGWREAGRVIDVSIEQAERLGGEVVVASGAGDHHDLGEHGRWITTENHCLFALRATAVMAATGEVIAIGEDHAVPRPDWAEKVLAAHERHPDADVVVGCLVNATDRTWAGRVNFIAFAAPFSPPMPALRVERPPPISAVTIKRRALARYRGSRGELETEILPRLFAEGRAIADDAIQIDHYQDHGLRWSIVNAYFSARGSYGLARTRTTATERRRQAKWAIVNVPRNLFNEARTFSGGSRIDVLGTLPLVVAAGTGAALGALVGPGHASERVA